MSTLIIGLATTLFFSALAVLSNVFVNATTTWWTTAMFTGFALLGVWVIFSYFTERHEVTDMGLHHARVLRGVEELKWSDVRRVSYSPGMKWFRLEARSGAVVRVSAMLVGLPGFAYLLLNGVDSAAIDSEARRLLEETANGNPPSVWH